MEFVIQGFINLLKDNKCRGDGDLGSNWYFQGKYESKMNTFLDTQDCIQALFTLGYTTPKQLSLYTRSAGGLIGGYMLNHYQDYIASMVIQVPFLDPIQDMIDPKVPWTAYEWYEWGNPILSFSIFESMLAYSPYENLKKSICKTSVLITSGFEDSRVPYYEPLKFIAKFRHYNPLCRDVLFKCTKSGHFSRSSQDQAEWYAFILSRMVPPILN